MKNKEAAFKFKPFSKKQLQVLTWWMPNSPVKDKDAIICDGSVRAGKTVVMSLSYVIWAMETFDSVNLGISGKTIGSLRRNVITPLKLILKGRGYKVKDHRADNYLTISYKGKSNEFYVFGGKDESSQDLIQGITLAGMFFDEVALMPESFVNQATARCSVEGSKLWFNCNPEGPYHWFKVEWLDKLEEKNAVHLHFTMDDNLSLSERVRERYRRMYTGIFFKRYILGLWVLAEGTIYDMFTDEANTYSDGEGPNYDLWYQRYYSIDYGTINPFAVSEIIEQDGLYYIENEYYYDSKKETRQKDDDEYAEDLLKFIDGKRYLMIIIDPSAASFKVTLRKKGLRTKDADNDVLDGIRLVASLFALAKLKVNRNKCPNLLKERASYIWDEKAAERGEEKPVKAFDHMLDNVRYFAKTIVKVIRR
jgi:phage terminase, large subunit, PBSX family